MSCGILYLYDIWGPSTDKVAVYLGQSTFGLILIHNILMIAFCQDAQLSEDVSMAALRLLQNKWKKCLTVASPGNMWTRE